VIGSGASSAPWSSMIPKAFTLFFISIMSSVLFLIHNGCMLMQRNGILKDCIVHSCFKLATNSKCLHD
jgi:hypothetical protein